MLKSSKPAITPFFEHTDGSTWAYLHEMYNKSICIKAKIAKSNSTLDEYCALPLLLKAYRKKIIKNPNFLQNVDLSYFAQSSHFYEIDFSGLHFNKVTINKWLGKSSPITIKWCNFANASFRIYFSDATLLHNNFVGFDFSGASFGTSTSQIANNRGLIDAGNRSDGYRFIGWQKDGINMVNAGCRFFSVKEGRKHWQYGPRKNTYLSAESLAKLDYIDRMLKAEAKFYPSVKPVATEETPT